MKLDGNAIRKLGTVFGLTLLAIGLLALPARADTFSVTGDLPVTMSLALDDGQGNKDTKDASSVAGYKLGLSLPFLIGFGYESYGGKFGSNKAVPASFKYDVTMFDIFLNLPIPFVNIALGGGLGTGKISDVPGVDFKDASLTQWFASVGIPIATVFDVHVGYHSFSGKNKADTAGVPDIKVDGNMVSIGAKFGF